MKQFNHVIIGIGALLSVGASPAYAHHSYTSFDPKFLTISGTVKEYQFTNPHIWIQIVVNNPDGTATEWGLESGSTVSMKRAGMNSRLLKTGDRITATIHPKRDGRKEGSLTELVLPDGRVIKTGDLVTLGAGAPPKE